MHTIKLLPKDKTGGAYIMAKVMSEQMKYQLANDLGFGDKVADGDWSDVTSGEIGSMVREAIRRGSEAVEQESNIKNSVANQNIK